MTHSDRIAAAPISWGICEVEDWGYQFPAEDVLTAMQSLGVRGTELGPLGFLAADLDELAEQLDAFELRGVGSFITVAAHRIDQYDHAIELAKSTALRLSGSAFLDPVIVVAIIAGEGSDGYDTEVHSASVDWETVCRTLDGMQAAASDVGVPLALHPHYGTLVQTPEEIDQVMRGSSVGLCFDSGHIAVGGGDPATIARKYADRIQHVHLKDVNKAVAAKVAAEEMSYSDAVSSGLYCELGSGDAHIDEVIASLCKVGYDGWYVLEQDVRLQPDAQAEGAPLRAASASKAFVESVLGAVNETAL